MLFNTQTLVAVMPFLCSTASAWTYTPPSQMTSLPVSVPNAATQQFQPILKVENGCVPYPAIDFVNGGRVSEGLQQTGAINGGCSQNKGQIYTRSGTFGGRYGIMYAWYFPKDQVANGPAGHRHDWEGLVVWLSSNQPSASILAICPARHGTGQGNYHCDKPGNLKVSGTHPKIIYKPDGTHAVFTYSGTDNLGQHPAIDWNRMGDLGQQMLTEADWGSAQVPFLNWNFGNNMNNAKAAAGL